jgi:oxygen-dependent protoporphyrinogen oxidase
VAGVVARRGRSRPAILISGGNMKKIAIIGAGISGLSTAFAIERLADEAGLGVDVTVFERDERTGGKIWSIKDEGYLCEWGPNGFLDSKPMTL